MVALNYQYKNTVNKVRHGLEEEKERTPQGGGGAAEEEVIESKKRMVGSVGGGSDRSKEVVGMMALHEALRAVCLNSDWTYSVFWTIRPRPRSRGGSGCKVSDENGSLMLMWEDGFCKGAVGECLGEMNGEEDLIRKAFSKMSIQLYNYGEGLMGKVASDKCHKWVFKEPSECEPNISNHWQSSFDALPPEWTDQFNSGIQTIAVIQAGHGLLQLGSCKIIPEDLHFVLRMRHTFESLGYQSGFYLSQLFSSTRSTTNPSPPPKHVPPTPIFNWSQRPMPAPITTSFHTSAARIGLPTKDETHLFLLPQATDTHVQEMVPDHDAELKWPTGLSFFNALTGRTEDSKLLFGGMEALGDKPAPQHPFVMSAKDRGSSSDVDANRDEVKPSQDDVNKLEHKFQRSSTMPVTSSSSLDSHGHDPVAGIYSDMMETFLE